MDYPKMLYKDGQAYTEAGALVPHQNTLVVNDEAEEESARADGFADLAATTLGADTIDGDETTEAPAGDESVAGAEGADSVDGGQAADDLEQTPGGLEPLPGGPETPADAASV